MRQRGVPGSGTPPGVPGSGTPPGGTRVRYPLGWVPGGVTGSGTPPGGVPRGGTRVRYPPGGYQGGTRVRYPPRGGYPGRTTEGVFTTRRAVCLLRLRRRTFLCNIFYSNGVIPTCNFCSENDWNIWNVCGEQWAICKQATAPSLTNHMTSYCGTWDTMYCV